MKVLVLMQRDKFKSLYSGFWYMYIATVDGKLLKYATNHEEMLLSTFSNK